MVSVTLRKALRIKKQVEANLRTSSSSLIVNLDIDDPRALETLVKAEEKSYVESIERQLRLSSILSSIRMGVETQNAKGVNAIMSQIGHIDRQIAAYKPIAEAKPVNVEMLGAKLARKRDASKTPQVQTHGYGHRADDGSTIQFTPLTQETISSFKTKLVDLRKAREVLEDQRLALNNREDLSIEIGEDDIEFLRGLEIV